MNPELQEVVKQIADAVERRLSRRFDEIDARFEVVDARFGDIDRRLSAVDARFDAVDARFDAVDARFDAVDARLDAVDARFDRVDARFDAADARLAAQFKEAETRLAQGAQANKDELRDLVQRAAEGYGATLESLERRFDRLEKKVDTGFADQGKILRQHTLQLNALGRKQSTPRSSRR